MVAVDLGGSGIRAAQFTKSKSGPVIGKVGFIDLPPGAIEGGEVRDAEKVSAALKELWSEAKFSSKQVIFGVANSNVLVRIKTLDWDVDADFRKSLKYQPGVAEDLSFDIERANLDYHTLHEYLAPTADGSEKKKMKTILLVATEKDMVDGFVQAIKGAGLQPVRADLTPFALIRSVNPLASGTDSNTVEVIIDMGLDITNVILHQNGQPRFVRIVSGSAGRHLTRTLSEQFSWSLDDAERVKRQFGLTDGMNPDGSAHAAQQIINHLVSAFITEIRTSIDYFLANTPSIDSVSRVILTGGGSNIKGLRERISSELRIPVENAIPTQTVSTAKGFVLPEGLSESHLSAAFGLATGTE